MTYELIVNNFYVYQNAIKTKESPTDDSEKSKSQEKNVPSSNEKKPKNSGLFGWVKGKLGVKDDDVHLGDKLR